MAHLDIVLLVALKGKDVKKSEMTNLLLFFEDVYLSATDRKIWLIGLASCCL